MDGNLDGNTGNTDLAAKTIKRAYDLKDRTSEYEKLAIAANYNFFVTRDLEKAVQFWEQLTNTYPRGSGRVGRTGCQLRFVRPG